MVILVLGNIKLAEKLLRKKNNFLFGTSWKKKTT